MKAGKHANSNMHKFCAEAAETRKRSEPVTTQLIIAANKQESQDATAMKNCFRAAYLLFNQEIPHTTNWRPLMSTLAKCDSSGLLKTYLTQCPCNGHHLSTTRSQTY